MCAGPATRLQRDCGKARRHVHADCEEGRDQIAVHQRVQAVARILCPSSRAHACPAYSRQSGQPVTASATRLCAGIESALGRRADQAGSLVVPPPAALRELSPAGSIDYGAVGAARNHSAARAGTGPGGYGWRPCSSWDRRNAGTWYRLRWYGRGSAKSSAPRVNHESCDLFLIGRFSLMDAILEVPDGRGVESLACDDESEPNGWE